MTTTSTAHRAPVVAAPGLFTAAWIIAGRTISVAGEHALGLALIWPLLLTATFLPLAARRFRNGGQ